MNNILNFINSKDDYLVLTHINPDGDALGSAFSLTAGLRLLGKRAAAALLAPIPFKYDFREFEPFYIDFKEADLTAFKSVIAVDCANIRRLGDAREFFKKRDSLNIDHHISNDGYADVNFIEDCAATGELIYAILTALNVSFDNAVRLGIYTAIATDTGNLTFSNTTARSFNICAKMVDQGLNIPHAAGRIFNTRTYGATKLIAEYIDNMHLCEEDKISVSSLSLKEISKCAALPEDCETLINYGKDIESVEVAVFIREVRERTYKVSMRSKNYVNVSEIASQFGGGGHIRAAGCLIEGEYKDVEKMVLETVRDYLK